MNIGKRALVLMLSVLMTFSTLPVSVFAGDEAAPAEAPKQVEAQEPVKEKKPEPTPEAPAEPKEEAAPEAPAAEPVAEPAAETPATETADPAAEKQTGEEAPKAEEAAPTETEETSEKEEVKYPAQTLKVTASDGAVITVKAPEGAFPEGSYVKATPVSEEAVLALIDGAAEAAAYDITVYDKDGKEVQPEKSVKVSMANTGLSGADAVYHVNDAMTKATLVTDNIDDPSDTFTVDHFSIYVIEYIGDSETTLNGVPIRASGGMSTNNVNGQTVTLHVGDSYMVTNDASGTSENEYNQSKLNEWNNAWHIWDNGRNIRDGSGGLGVQMGGYRDKTIYGKAVMPYLIITVNAPPQGSEYWIQYYSGASAENPPSVHIKVVDRCTVTFDANGHGTAPATQTLDEGNTATKPTDPTAEGYLFKGWYENADCTGSEFDFSTPITEDKTLYAKWAKSCTITFKDEDGTVLSEKQYGEGTPVSKIDVPTPSKDDDHDYFYDFAGWSPELVDVTENAVYTATYSSTPKIYYTIHYERNCPTSFDSMDMPSDQVEAVKSGTSKPVEVAFGPSSYSAYFLGWTDNPEGEGTVYNRNGYYGSSKTITLGETDETSITLYAKWNYSIYFYPNGGDLGEVQQKIASSNPAGLTIPSEIPQRKGYEFLGWSTSSKATEAEYAAGSTFTPKQFSTSLYAIWRINEYKIDYELDGGSLEAGNNPETYTVETATFKLNNPKKEGYMFKGWTGTGLDAASDEVIIANGSTGDRSYTATWKELLNYQLEVTPISAGEKADYPTIKEKDGLSDNVSGSQWVTSQTELDKYKACFAGTSDDWDSIETYHEEFEPGDTYYALAFLRFDDDEEPDTSRVKLVETDTIKQAGEPAVRSSTNVVMIPFSATVPAGPSYKIEYDLDGGSLKEGVTNPDSYTAADTFTLNNPVKEGYMFKGWTGTGLTEATKEVTIPKKSTGERAYKATWKKLQNYRLQVAQINAGDKVSPPEVSEADGKQGVMASAMASWVETQEMLDLYKACCAGDSTEWDSVIPYRGTFEAGKTYYGLASLKFEEDEEPDISRVKLVETDTIKQAGKPVIDRFDRSVIIPFSAAIPAEELDDYALNVKMINAGEQAYASTVSEADGKTAVTGVSWVEDEDELRQLVAYWSRESGVHPTRFDETFKGGETYYSLALVSFDVNETPDPSRVKLNETEYIKQEGAMVVHRDENNKDENVVIVPFSAKIPEKKITVSVDFGSDHSGFAANVAAHDPTNMKVSGSIVSFEAYAGENLESDGLVPLYDALDDMSPWEDSDHRLYVPYFVNGKDISNYSDFEQFNADYNNSIDITMTEDVTVYAQWLTHTQADIEITIPECGKTTTEYPAPEIVVSGSDDTVTVLDDAKDWYSVSEMVPFKGEFEGGNTYIATASISPKFGYFFDEKDITVKDNKDNPASYSLQYGYLMVNVSVEHDWGDWEVTKAPTQEEDGEETRVCKGDPSHKETRVIQHGEHEHKLELVEGKAATCTARGQIDYYRCTVDGCSYIFKDKEGAEQIGLSDTIIPPTGHKAGKPTETYTPATCNSVGVHILITKCTNEGCTTGVLGIDVETDPIDPDAHDWGDWEVVTPATCTSEGEATRVCKNESLHKETRTLAIDEDAHDWGDWEVTKEPTTTEEGEETRVCKNDPSHTETRAIPKIAEYTITYDLNGGSLDGETGTVSFTVEAGTEITLPEPTRDGYEFDYWQGSKYYAGDKYTVNGDHTFTAQWIAAVEDADDKDSSSSEKKSKGVDTGDATGLIGWLLLGIAAEAGAVYMYRRRREY